SRSRSVQSHFRITEARGPLGVGQRIFPKLAICRRLRRRPEGCPLQLDDKGAITNKEPALPLCPRGSHDQATNNCDQEENPQTLHGTPPASTAMLGECCAVGREGSTTRGVDNERGRRTNTASGGGENPFRH